MTMETLMTEFLADTIAMMLATGLCIVVVRDRLCKPLGRVLGVWLVSSAGVNAFEVVPWLLLPEDTMTLITNGVLVLYLVGLCEACRIPLDYTLIIFYLAVMVPLVAPSYFLLRRVLWPIVRDLESKAWRMLWVIPCTFSILLIIMSYAFLEAVHGDAYLHADPDAGGRVCDLYCAADNPQPYRTAGKAGGTGAGCVGLSVPAKGSLHPAHAANRADPRHPP